MSEDLRYKIHLRRLNDIKHRINHYPVYDTKPKGVKSPSPKKMVINQLLSEIKTNTINISVMKKRFAKKKPINFELDDKYIYDREAENIRKQLFSQLITDNNNLKVQVKALQNGIYYYK